jgi:5'(3')-deoxyribonucleotidase
MKPVLFVDMDNTLNNFWEPFVEIAKEKYPDAKPFLKRTDLHHYSVAKCMGLSKEDDDEISHRIMTTPSFWRGMPLLEKSIPKILEELYEEYDLYIATTPYVGFPDCCRLKTEWLEKYFPFIDPMRMIFTWHKELLKGDFIIEDNPKVPSFFEGTTILLDYPYNKDCTPDFRVPSWDTIRKIL